MKVCKNCQWYDENECVCDRVSWREYDKANPDIDGAIISVWSLMYDDMRTMLQVGPLFGCIHFVQMKRLA